MNSSGKVLEGGTLLIFAKRFSDWNTERFNKDVDICLTPDANGKHAYFPCLMACIGILDMFSGLYAGTLDPKLSDLKRYAEKFMPSEYKPLLLAVLYNCFRHKVAHLAHPYDVLDTSALRTKKDFEGEPRRLITWSVDEADKTPRIALERLQSPMQIQRAPDGWNVQADHVVHVHLLGLSKDIVQSIDSYISSLREQTDCHENFAKCMREYFPT